MITGNKVAFYVLILSAGILCFLFIDQIIQFITENLLGAATLGAVGGGALAANKQKRQKLQVERDEHERLEGEKLDSAVERNIEADRHHVKAQELANDIREDDTEPQNIPEGFKRESATSRR